MAYSISDECISCRRCSKECPTGAIYEGIGKYEIEGSVCVDCGSCEDICPVKAIRAE